MTEAEWLEGTDLRDLLASLDGNMSARKSRLCGVALFRCFLPKLCPNSELRSDGRVQGGLEVAERYADGLATESEREAAWLAAAPVASWAAVWIANTAALTWQDAVEVFDDGTTLYDAEERARQCRILRDIFGNPFRRVAFDPAWRTDTAVALARQMYGSRDFGAMPILADALQDAGCDSEDILAHCRDPKPVHVRGCWVVDLVLGKG